MNPTDVEDRHPLFRAANKLRWLAARIDIEENPSQAIYGLEGAAEPVPEPVVDAGFEGVESGPGATTPDR